MAAELNLAIPLLLSMVLVEALVVLIEVAVDRLHLSVPSLALVAMAPTLSQLGMRWLN